MSSAPASATTWSSAARHPRLRHRQRAQVRQADRHDRQHRRQAAKHQGRCRQSGDTQAALHHARDAVLRRSGDREDRVGEGAPARVRPPRRHARRQDAVRARRSRRTSGTSSTRRRARCSTAIETKSGAHNTICRPRRQAGVPRRAEVAVPVRRGHEDAQGRRQGRAVRGGDPAVHGQRRAIAAAS